MFEYFRLRVLSSMAKTMVQLATLPSFDNIGCIQEDPGTPGKYMVGPVHHRDVMVEKEDPRVEATGPFDTAAEHLAMHTNVPDGGWGTSWAMATGRLLPVLVTYLPQDDDRFVLELPGFDSSNILVDASGRVTGITDWDLAQTVPGYVGYARYPGWIARDWDPVWYRPDSEHENSPMELNAYRDYYATELERALVRRDDPVCAFVKHTRRSHRYEAIWIALHSKPSRTEIVRKFLQLALPKHENSYHHMIWIGEDRYEDEEREELKEGFDWLFHSDDSAALNPLAERPPIVVSDSDESEAEDEAAAEA